MRSPIESIDIMKTSSSQSSEFLGLNDDEIKRIASVIERDFKLRQKEYKRIQELKKVIRQEQERVGHLTGSERFNNELCIRCLKPFKIFFNPKELCSQCKLNVCHNCATDNKQSKTWTCKTCLQLNELESLTADWFYLETRKKYKRCGSAEIVHELYKREKERNQIDEDLGYATLQKTLSTDSRDSGSVVSYVVHDKNLQRELDEYAKRLSFLIDNLKSDCSTGNTQNFEDHKQQLASEINRARTALNGPIRRSNKKLNLSYDIDLQNLLIQKTEEILQTNLQQYQNSLITSSFDQKLAQIIFDKYVKKDILNIPPKSQRQLPSVPSNQNHFSSVVWEMTSHNDTLRKMHLSRTSALDEEDTEKEEENKSRDITPTRSSIEDHDRRSIDTDFETMKKSTERVDEWKTNFTIMESKIIPVDNDDQEEYSTWL